jgi:hypothetical protein
MAELLTEHLDYSLGQRMRVRTKNALGRWDWLVDGDTGKPVEVTMTDTWAADLANPRQTIEAVHRRMLHITDRASILEHQPW